MVSKFVSLRILLRALPEFGTVHVTLVVNMHIQAHHERDRDDPHADEQHHRAV
jgi:hypothetical protein